MPEPDPWIEVVSGFGGDTVGGAGGTVIYVTNLNDSGPGSLREALAAQIPREIRFAVGGFIDLESQLEILYPYCTIAGETAPEPGITLRNIDGRVLGGVGALLKIGKMQYGKPELYGNYDVHDIIVRHLRFRHGDGERDKSGGVVFHNGYRVAIQHCSFQWGPDNLIAAWLVDGDPGIHDISIQYCLFGEPFAEHGTGAALHGYHDFTDPENLNEYYKNVYNISVHHNLFSTVGWRIPMTRSGGIEFVNNVIYNLDYYAWQPNADDRSDFVANYIKPGPCSAAPVDFHQMSLHGHPGPASLYIADNYYLGYPAGADEWEYIVDVDTTVTPDLAHRRLTRLPQPSTPIVVENAEDILASVCALAGAVRPRRDAVDTRLVREVLTNTGRSALPVNMADVGGYPW